MTWRPLCLLAALALGCFVGCGRVGYDVLRGAGDGAAGGAPSASLDPFFSRDAEGGAVGDASMFAGSVAVQVAGAAADARIFADEAPSPAPVVRDGFVGIVGIDAARDAATSAVKVVDVGYEAAAAAAPDVAPPDAPPPDVPQPSPDLPLPTFDTGPGDTVDLQPVTDLDPPDRDPPDMDPPVDAPVDLPLMTPDTGSGDSGPQDGGADAAPVAVKIALRISAGRDHSCAVVSDGTVWCWGYGNGFQLGQGTIADALTPVQASMVTGAVLVSAGDVHTLIVGAGSAAGWGENGAGQLGDGTWNDRPLVSAGTVLIGNILDFDSGGDHACARTTTRDVYCWGLNSFRQVGSNGGDVRNPTPLGFMADQVSAGGTHTCARDQGTVRCWGNGQYGQLGDGTRPNAQRTPLTVANLAGATDVSAGRRHSCAIAGGQVYCWGENVWGQLGDGTNTERTTATLVPSLAGATAVSAGGADNTGTSSHTCVLLGNGQVQCWGAGVFGQLGYGANSPSPSPVGVSGGGFVEISAGGEFSCGRRSDGSVWCWGRGDRGRLGDGLATSSNVPVRVVGF